MKTMRLQAVLLISLIFSFLVPPKYCNGGTGTDSLKYIGHSFVKIKTASGIVIYIDPYAVNDFTDSADVVLITHEHSDHNDITRVIRKSSCVTIKGENAIVNGAYQSYTVGDIKIRAVAAYNSNHLKNQCVGYVLEFDGIKIYHAGDTGKIPEMADLASDSLTYALLPMDGIYTMTPEGATEAAGIIKAKYDMPIHTMPPPDSYSDAIVGRFTSPNKIIIKPDSTFALEGGSITPVQTNAILPQGFKMDQNYPNPFNPSTTINFQLPTNAFVTLRVYDILGREVATLVNQHRNAGSYSVKFDADNLPSGIYFYRYNAGAYSRTMKLTVLK
jgi:L-ascorbate metabolism protein UlaG (beta-lactamase superfamily)